MSEQLDIDQIIYELQHTLYLLKDKTEPNWYVISAAADNLHYIIENLKKVSEKNASN